MQNNNNPQWHDFPFVEGLYAIKNDGYYVLVTISVIDNDYWLYRGCGSAYSHPFDPENYRGEMFGPIKLPK